MIAMLSRYYSLRQSGVYRLSQLILRHVGKLLLFSALFLLGYPLVKYGYFAYQQHQQTKEIAKLHATVAEQQIRFEQSMPSFHQQAPEENLALLNQQLHTLFSEQKIPIERLQWQFDGGKTLELVSNATTAQILAAIETINRLPNLRFTEVRLLKLNYEQKIQLHATLIPFSPPAPQLNKEAQ